CRDCEALFRVAASVGKRAAGERDEGPHFEDRGEGWRCVEERSRGIGATRVELDARSRRVEACAGVLRERGRIDDGGETRDRRRVAGAARAVERRHARGGSALPVQERASAGGLARKTQRARRGEDEWKRGAPARDVAFRFRYDERRRRGGAQRKRERERIPRR